MAKKSSNYIACKDGKMKVAPLLAGASVAKMCTVLVLAPRQSRQV